MSKKCIVIALAILWAGGCTSQQSSEPSTASTLSPSSVAASDDVELYLTNEAVSLGITLDSWRISEWRERYGDERVLTAQIKIHRNLIDMEGPATFPGLCFPDGYCGP